MFWVVMIIFAGALLFAPALAFVTGLRRPQ
jgi:hypothetical protein